MLKNCTLVYKFLYTNTCQAFVLPPFFDAGFGLCHVAIQLMKTLDNELDILVL